MTDQMLNDLGMLAEGRLVQRGLAIPVLGPDIRAVPDQVVEDSGIEIIRLPCARRPVQRGLAGPGLCVHPGPAAEQYIQNFGILGVHGRHVERRGSISAGSGGESGASP